MKLSRIILLVSAITLLVLPAVRTHAADASAGYHELRLYTVTSNKIGGVLERFRRALWKAYLTENKLEPKALLRDRVHLELIGLCKG